MLLRNIILAAGLATLSGAAGAFERDVHFGLTKWLALQAGFTLQQADAIATGDQRVDSGDMQYIGLVSTYACLGKDQEGAADAGRHHYPSPGRVPAPPEQRVVTAGGDPARGWANAATKVSEQQSSFLLYKLGEAIHELQDTWSHQGVPEVPKMLEGVITCDPMLAWGHPHARGGWNSHKADLTYAWPADAVAMAKATYDFLRQYPPISDQKREPKDWGQIRPQLDGFVKAATKSDKKKWFASQGIAEVSFLESISLPDGAEPFTEVWAAHKLPPLPKIESLQHHIDEKLLAFFNGFFMKWLSTDDFEATASEFGLAAPATGAARGPTNVMTKPELVARLQVWRIRDHGRVADIAHTPSPLTPQQRAQVASIAKNTNALMHYTELNEAFFPMLVKGPEPSPLLGFIIHPIAASSSGNQRVVATVKFRHAPYDTLVVLAERMDGRWRVTSLGATVDH